MKIIFITCLAFIVAACNPVSRTIKNQHVLGNIDGMEKVNTKDKHALVYKLPGFELGKYSKFKILPVLTVAVNESEIPAVDRLRLEKYLRDTVQRELTEGGYDVVETNSPDVLGIQFTLTNVDSGNPYLNVIQFVTYGMAPATGGVSIETQFFNTVNSQVQAVAVIGADGANMFNGNSLAGKWADVEKIFDDWAAGFRNKVDEVNS